MSAEAHKDEMITLISKEQHEFVISKDAARISGTLRSILDNPVSSAEHAQGTIVLDQISTETLDKVIQYFYYKLKYQKDPGLPFEDFKIPQELALDILKAGMNVEQIDHLCMVAVNTTSTEERQQAEEALKTLKPNDFVAILSMSNCEISHFFAFSRLSWMIETEWDTITDQQKAAIREAVLGYQLSRIEIMSDLIIRESSLVLAKIIKLSWLASSIYSYREIKEAEAKQSKETFEMILNRFLPKDGQTETNFKEKKIGLIILTSIISEISTFKGDLCPLIYHRSVCFSMRDEFLKDVMERATSLFLSLISKSVAESLIPFCTDLLLVCYNFDFDGNDFGRKSNYVNDINGESSEDDSYYSFPNSWSDFLSNSVFIDNLLKMFFSEVPKSESAMEILIKILSAKISPNNQKLTDNICSIFQTFDIIMASGKGLNKEENLYMFCRALSQLKLSWNALIIVKSPQCLSFFLDFKLFTTKVVTSNTCDTGCRYLYRAWASVASVLLRFTDMTKKRTLAQYCNEIAQLAVNQKLRWCISEDLDEVVQTLANTKELEAELSFFPELTRLNLFARFVEWMKRIMSTELQAIQNETNFPLKCKHVLCLTVLVNISTFLLKKKYEVCDVSSKAVDEEVAKTLCEMMYSCAEMLYTREGSNKPTPLDCLKIAFMNALHVIVSKFIFVAVSSVSESDNGLHFVPFQFQIHQFLRKYFANPEYQDGKNTPAPTFLAFTFAHIFATLEKNVNSGAEDNELVIPHTLKFLNQLVTFSGCYTFVLNYYHDVEFIIDGRKTMQLFPFLKLDCSYRSIWYQILGNIIFDESLQDRYWEQFFFNYESSLSQALISGNIENKITACQVILSDMIGLTKSIPNVYVYNDFFEWFQRRVYPIIDAIVKPATQMNILFPNETFSQRLLRLCERLTRNSMRTHLFDCSSPIPILLCRDVIEITNILAPKAAKYLKETKAETGADFEKAIKSVEYTMRTFCNLVEGKYANLGAFGVFGDDSFSKYIENLLVLVFSRPPSAFKRCQSYTRLLFNFFDDLCTTQSEQMLRQSHSALGFLLSTLKDGCEMADYEVSTFAFSAVAALLTRFYRETQRKVKTAIYENFAAFLQFPQTIKTIQELLSITIKSGIYGGTRSVFSLSRSLLPMIILFPEYYEQTKMLIVSQTEATKRAELKRNLDALTNDVGNSLSMHNKSTFTDNMNILYADSTSLRMA